MTMTHIDPLSMIRPRRKIEGISAILLPFAGDGSVDWPAFRAHVLRTADAGLTPAVNMDTGYANLIDEPTRRTVLAETRALVGGAFVAGAFVNDRPGDALNLDAYRRAIDGVQEFGGTPVIFQSYGLTALGNREIVRAYHALARDCPRFIAFELGQQFAPFGRIYDLETYDGLMEIPQCVGAKHSSLSRELEWEHLRLRDQNRPDFRVYTGNDLGIDMVMYGSDYLLGLSTFAPDLFAKRDHYWLNGDSRFFELNDLLQYLGFFAFRPPVPAYKHSAAMFLKLRGWIASDATHSGSPTRPDSDRAVLRDIVERLSDW
ncbi:MAG: dihydrodipicolinate synthase family protein [Gemmataceae bacterium]